MIQNWTHVLQYPWPMMVRWNQVVQSRPRLKRPWRPRCRRDQATTWVRFPWRSAWNMIGEFPIDQYMTGLGKCFSLEILNITFRYLLEIRYIYTYIYIYIYIYVYILLYIPNSWRMSEDQFFQSLYEAKFPVWVLVGTLCLFFLFPPGFVGSWEGPQWHDPKFICSMAQRPLRDMFHWLMKAVPGSFILSWRTPLYS